MANLLVLWTLIFFYRINSYYVGFLSADTQLVLFYLAAAYTLGGLVRYYFNPKAPPTHAYEAIVAINRWLSETGKYLSSFPYDKNISLPTISKAEKTSVLFLLVKAFFLPIMVNFFLGNYGNAQNQLQICLSRQFVLTMQSLYTLIFPMLINVFLLIDTGLFFFGYSVETARCNNVVKSVEPTLFGWIVALACYPPFNGMTTTYASWYSSEAPVFNSIWMSVIAGAAMMLCYAIYLWGSISLGVKCSNLTNRGIVTTGVYAYVRHPAYIAKNLAWWIGTLPVLSLPAILSMSCWTLIYFLRAITEERHLIQDPDYREYCKKVRYRFIPHIY